ncbi:hypothetical protein DdX_13605 [Ditylenchus destructor]|uniref:Secreted protein n=1 Tax=Ditylenchus destructor TaxID=166010 RepID=A0AAD4R2P9_9BILA|nr:hypothetical protein DdX_13605 [Ditylenchus destructor]
MTLLRALLVITLLYSIVGIVDCNCGDGKDPDCNACGFNCNPPAGKPKHLDATDAVNEESCKKRKADVKLLLHPHSCYDAQLWLTCFE